MLEFFYKYVCMNKKKYDSKNAFYIRKYAKNISNKSRKKIY